MFLHEKWFVKINSNKNIYIVVQNFGHNNSINNAVILTSSAKIKCMKSNNYKVAQKLAHFCTPCNTTFVTTHFQKVTTGKNVFIVSFIV